MGAHLLIVTFTPLQTFNSVIQAGTYFASYGNWASVFDLIVFWAFLFLVQITKGKDLHQHALCRRQEKPQTCCQSIAELTQIDR